MVGRKRPRPNVEVTGAARLHRTASLWTAGLVLFFHSLYAAPAFAGTVDGSISSTRFLNLDLQAAYCLRHSPAIVFVAGKLSLVGRVSAA